MWKKEYSYQGQLSIKLDNNAFTFYAAYNDNQVAIKYDIFDSDFQLTLKVDRNDTYPDSVSINLEKTSYLICKENILTICVSTPYLCMDFTSGNDCKSFEKSIQVMGSYTLTCDKEVVEVMYTDEDNAEYCVIANPQMTFYSIYHWLCKIYEPLNCFPNLVLFVKDSLIEDSQIIETISSNEKIIVDMAEKCYASPKTEDAAYSILQWSRNDSDLKRRLSAILKIDIDKVILLDRDKEIIDDDIELEIENFRNEDMNDAPNIFYDLIGKTIRCTSIFDMEVMEVMIAADPVHVSEIKCRLGFKLKIKERRILICNNQLLLANDDIVTSLDDKLEYCCGVFYEDIKSKKEIARGSLGKVYKWSDEIALKILNVPTDIKQKYNIIRELISVRKVEPHPNIVRFFDIYIDGDDIGVSMEYMKEGSLRDYIDKKKILDEIEIRRFSLDIVHGLTHLHGKGTCHRDIKAANVLLGDDRVAKLCDFGLSKISDDTRTTLYNDRTQTTGCGTERWRAPEIIRGERYGFKADVWSVGATLVEMITGKIPFEGEDDCYASSHIGHFSKIEYTSPIGMSKELQEFVDACLKPTSNERPKAHELLLLPFLR